MGRVDRGRGAPSRRAVVAAAVALALIGCDRSTPVPEQTARVGCGLCRFRMPGATGCFWAVELGGHHHAVVGPTPQDHDSHGPVGMCVMDREAVVAGRIKRGQFLATKFELIDTEASASQPVVPHTH